MSLGTFYSYISCWPRIVKVVFQSFSYTKKAFEKVDKDCLVGIKEERNVN